MYVTSDSHKENTNQSETKRSDSGKITAYSFADSRPEAIQIQQLQAASAKSQAKHPIAQLKKASTFPGTPVVQLASSIEYNTTDFDLEDGTKEVVGQKAEAHLESAHPLNGSAPGDRVQEGLMTGLKKKGFKRMIRGHLMNGQLGGLGIALNLFPITAKANSQHKNHVENKVKDLITKGKDVNYTVEVQSNNKLSDPGASFKCDVKDLKPLVGNKDESFNDVVYSMPTKNDKSKGDEGAVLNSKAGLSFPTKKLKNGWGEAGKGFDNKNGTHLNTMKNISGINGNGIDKLTNDYVEGRNFVSGGIDIQEYAYELLDQFADSYDDTDSVKYLGMDLDTLEKAIDDEKSLDSIVSHLKSILGV